MTKPIIYLIRHGEKPATLANGEEAQGLSPRGMDRAKGLIDVFGPSADFKIGYILAEKPQRNGDRTRPYYTVKPLADSLGVDIDTTISRNDATAVAQAVRKYNGKNNVLICWEHGQLADIVQALGVKEYSGNSGWTGEIKYPSERFDLIWTVPPPYKEITSVTSEGVEKLDTVGTGTSVSQFS